MEIYEFYSKVLGVSNEKLLSEVCQLTSCIQIKKKQKIFSVGEIPKNFYFLINGFFRGFFENEDGQEITECFGFGLGYCLVPDQNLSIPSRVNIEALVDSKVLMISVSSISKLLTEYVEVYEVYNKLVSKAIEQQYKVKDSLRYLPAVEKYKLFLEKYPGVIYCAGHSQIASFLNITPVTLSRVRRQLREEENTTDGDKNSKEVIKQKIGF